VFGGVAALAVVVLATIAVVWLWPRTASKPAATTSGLDPDKVVVAVFVNQTGDATLDALGMQISDWVTQNLTRITPKVAINPELPTMGGPGLPRSVLAKAADPLRALAERTGAGLVVTGAYYLEGDRLRIQSQVVDAQTGDIAITIPPSVGPRSTPSDVTADLTLRVMGALAARQNKPFSGYRSSVPYRAPSYEAYLELTQAVAAFGPASYPDAERHLRRSLLLDPGYMTPRLWLWGLLNNQSRFAEADDVLRSCEEPTAYSQATPAEQAMVRLARARLDGNLRGAVAAASDGARLAPSPASFYMLGLRERDFHRPRAAIESLSRIRVEDMPYETGPGAYWYLDTRASVHHELGEYDMELEVARLGQQHYAGVAAFFAAEIRAMVASGRTAEIDAIVTRAEQAAGNSNGTGSLLSQGASELRAHGHADAAQAMASRAAEYYKRRLDTGKPTPALRDSYASALVMSGDCRQGLPIRRDLARQAPDTLAYQGAYATALVSCGPSTRAARSGPPRATPRGGASREEARKIADALANIERPYLRGANLYQRARILAALGDGEGAVRELQAAFAKGNAWNGSAMHLDTCWDPIRTYPAFVEWVKPKG
jgi:TolB-like protein